MPFTKIEAALCDTRLLQATAIERDGVQRTAVKNTEAATHGDTGHTEANTIERDETERTVA